MKIGWIFLTALACVLWLATIASAGTVTVAFQEPPDRDLVRCRITLQNAAGAAVDSKEITAANNDQAHEGIVLNWDTRALQGQTGKVVGWCVDTSGQASVESAPLDAIFPDLAPLPPRIFGVQVQP